MNVPTLEEWLDIVNDDDLEEEFEEDVSTFFYSPLKSDVDTST